jgi:Tfp pilus assembly protein PilO
MHQEKVSKMNIPLLIAVILILIAVPMLAYVFALSDDNCHSYNVWRSDERTIYKQDFITDRELL